MRRILRARKNNCSTLKTNKWYYSFRHNSVISINRRMVRFDGNGLVILPSTDSKGVEQCLVDFYTQFHSHSLTVNILLSSKDEWIIHCDVHNCDKNMNISSLYVRSKTFKNSIEIPFNLNWSHWRPTTLDGDTFNSTNIISICNIQFLFSFKRKSQDFCLEHD